jgi:hypothetical protein
MYLLCVLGRLRGIALQTRCLPRSLEGRPCAFKVQVATEHQTLVYDGDTKEGPESRGMLGEDTMRIAGSIVDATGNGAWWLDSMTFSSALPGRRFIIRR